MTADFPDDLIDNFFKREAINLLMQFARKHKLWTLKTSNDNTIYHCCVRHIEGELMVEVAHHGLNGHWYGACETVPSSLLSNL